MSSGFLYAIGAAVVWGMVYTIDQKVLNNLNPLTFMFLSALLIVTVLLPFFVFGHGMTISLSSISGKTWFLVIITAILTVFAELLILYGIKTIGASKASIFEIIYPFFVVLFSYFAFRSSPSVYFIFGALLIFAGSAIIIVFG